MATFGTLATRIQRKEPLLWMSRLVIVESAEPLKIIRDIPLHRGLNVVWGVEATDDLENEPLVAGHGVGKTSFCRLLRYCLGEASFGNSVTRDLIRKAFPQGYVGAQVHVQGESWAIVRPFGGSRPSYARQNASVEEVLSERPARDSFTQFREHLATTGVAGIPTEMLRNPDRPIQWWQLFSWCSRDQEARYQHLLEWRSPRSDSDTPAFQKPKADAVWLLRVVLGLLTGDEVTLERRIQALENEIENIGGQIAERQREPEYWSRHYRRQLKQDFGIDEADTATFSTEDMFSLPRLVESKTHCVAEQISGLNGRIAELDKQVSLVAAKLAEVMQFYDEQSTSADITGQGTETLAQSADKWEKLKQTIRDHLNWPCTYGQITFGQCEHVQETLSRADDMIRQVRRDVTPDIAKRDQIVAELEETARRAAESVKRLREQHQQLLADRRQLEQELAELSSQSRGMKSALTALDHWESFLRSDTIDPKLTEYHALQKEKEEEKKKGESELKEKFAQHNLQVKRLQETFNMVVQAVLSDIYSGRVELTDSTIAFRITQNTALAGEAVETLAILLADMSAVLLGTEDASLHPGFLIHDSPREADLGLRIYQMFLRCMAALHVELGGPADAPFQYILTTTTPPPTEVKANGCLCLELKSSNDEYLFQKDLGMPVAVEIQEPLFAEKSDGNAESPPTETTKGAYS